MNWTDPNLSAPYLELLRDAIYNRRQVRMLYRSRSQAEPMQRDVDPYKLVSRWGEQYCIGYCHWRQAPRTFRLDRIAELEVLDQIFAEPTDFDLEAYMAVNPFFQPTVSARLRFPPESALLALNNRAFWETLEEQSDGAVIVTFVVPDMEAAAGLVLRIGFPVIIEEPPELLELVRTQARAIATHFASTEQAKED